MMSQNFEMQGCLWYESNGLNLILQTREIVRKGLGHVFITSSSSHFFNQSYVKPYLFKFGPGPAFNFKKLPK